MSDKKKILFLCTGNSCRSQMAEGWGKHLKGDDFHFYSAGIEAEGLNPKAVKVMKEEGVDITSQRSEFLEDLDKNQFDYVITVCSHADQTCPAFPGRSRKIHIPFDDPPLLAKEVEKEEKKLEIYRRVRDEIREMVENIEDYLEGGSD